MIDHERIGESSMKRKIAAGSAVALVLIVIMAVQPLRSAALGALSVFRVNQVDTITVSVVDIEEMAQNLSALQDIQEPDAPPVHIISQQKPAMQTLSSISDFTAFDVKLPAALKDQTPDIAAVDSSTTVFSLIPDAANSWLASLGSQYSLPDSIASAQYTLTTPPSLAVRYDAVTLIATQAPVLSSGDNSDVQTLWNTALTVPLIPDDVKSQLAAVNLSGGDVYLPVLDGLGRAANLNGTTGYLYTMSDLQSLLGTLFQDGLALRSPMGTALPGESDGMDEMQNASVLVWVQDGVLYALAGQVSDQELLSIAQSMK